MAPLTLERLQSLYAKFDPTGFGGWEGEYARVVSDFVGLDAATLRSEGAQDRLWRARGITSVGPGDSLEVSSAYVDREVVDRVVAIRGPLPTEPVESRAKALQDLYNELLREVHPKHAKKRPMAKLKRIFSALRPWDIHTCISWDSFRDVSDLVLGHHRTEWVESSVWVRARIDEALGEATEIDEAVRRSMFCWWLHEHRQEIEEDRTDASLALVRGSRVPNEQNGADTLAIRPFEELRKGVGAIAGYGDTYRAIVRVAMEPASNDDIAAAVQDEGLAVSDSTARSLAVRVRALGFVTRDANGIWRTTDDGERFLREDPPDILVERLIERVFSPAHTIAYLADGPKTPGEIAGHLRRVYPNWTSNRAPSSTIAWLKWAGVIETRHDSGSSVRALTDYGRVWLSRLPSELETPEPEPNDEATETLGDWPTFEEVWNKLLSDGGGHVFDQRTVRSLHAAWHSQPAKRFAILSGLSGSGKTALLLRYAEAYCACLGLADDLEAHRVTVPVSPDWRDPSGLLGYFNGLHEEPTFHVEPALRVLLDASRRPKAPFFLILDEMNLARVERYFAPMLSAMESQQPIVLHGHEHPIDDVPASIPWPSNVFIGGTVNMDETTHAFSDKVLDRAFTLEFWDIDLDGFFAGFQGPRIPYVEDLLRALNAILAPIRMHFGYRTANEVLRFVRAGIDAGGSEAEMVDQAVFSKVLPRIRGTESAALRDALEALRQRFAQDALPASERKVTEMAERLRVTGVTFFAS